MPNTYVALRTETLAVATNTITFNLTGISGYTDLVLVMNALQTSPSVNQTRIRVGNSSIDTGSNYSQTILYGNGTSALSTRASNQSYIDFDYTAAPGVSGNPNTIIANFMNYSNTTTNKTILHRASQATSGTDAIVSLWRSTAAINLINVFTASGNNFTVGSTFSLYGIANADQGAAKATGGIITEDSQYWYHTFGASGAFIPKQSLTCDVLVVAGGGGGGGWSGAGGGAGGLLGFTAQSLAISTSYPILVGAGGSGNINGGTGNGSDSQFGALTLIKGGGYGGGGNGTQASRQGGAGASSGGGGGSGSDGAGEGQPGTATPSGQGFSGGTSGSSPANNVRAGGGGGGASATGANAVNNTAGAGGNGSSSYSSWGSITGTGQNISGTYWYAGGGGGGTRNNLWTAGTSNVIGAGGNGGGGNGGGAATADTGSSALPNTGGGGGGGSYSYTGGTSTGGNGGSGIVIVRYAK